MYTINISLPNQLKDLNTAPEIAGYLLQQKCQLAAQIADNQAVDISVGFTNQPQLPHVTLITNTDYHLPDHAVVTAAKLTDQFKTAGFTIIDGAGTMVTMTGLEADAAVNADAMTALVARAQDNYNLAKSRYAHQYD